MEQYPITIEIGKDDVLAKMPFKDIIQAMVRAGISAQLGSPAAGLASLGHSVLTFEFNKPSLHQRGFELIACAIVRAGVDQLLAHEVKLPKDDLQKLSQTTSNFLKPLSGDLEINLTPLLFDDPLSMPFLEAFKLEDAYPAWLQQLGLTTFKASEISKAFPSHFRKALIVEWHSRRDYYKPIQEAFDHPWAEQWDQEYLHYQYYEKLRKLYHSPALVNIKIPLSEIYIEPDFEFDKKGQHTVSNSEVPQTIGYTTLNLETERYSLRHNLHKYINEQIQLSNNLCRLILLLGQPRQGKTSFCYRFIHDWINNQPTDQKLYYIQLQEIVEIKQLLERPFETIERHIKEEVKNITPRFKKDQNLVLILDGLNELYMSQGLGRGVLYDFYNQLHKRLNKCPNWIILLTSRHHYIELDDLPLGTTSVLKIAPLNQQQQSDWRKRYETIFYEVSPTQTKKKQLYQNSKSSPVRRPINRLTKARHIGALIGQPMLLHVDVSALESNKSLRRNELYEMLFDILVEKNTKKGREPPYKALNTKAGRKQFRHWLQCIAFELYQSGSGYIIRDDIQALPATRHLLKVTNTSLNSGLKYMISSFYFTENEHKDSALEFLDKSLQENLTIEYIIRHLQDTLLDEHGTFKVNDPIEVLKLFHELFAKKGLGDNLMFLYTEQIDELPDKIRESLHYGLKSALSYCLNHDFLYHYSSGSISSCPTQQIVHVFTAYWNLLASLSPEKNRDLLGSGGIEQRLFCRLLHLCSSQEHISVTNKTKRVIKLSAVNLSELYLNDLFLREADLEYADLTRATLRGVNLFKAEINHADLTGANLSYATLNETRLNGAVMVGAVLRHTDIINTQLNRADLREIDWRDADLSGAIIESAKVDHINFFECLVAQQVIGVEDLTRRYQVDPTPRYEDHDKEKHFPYYIIVEKQ